MARPRNPTHKRPRRPWTTANNCVKAVGDLASAKQLVYPADCCSSNCGAEQSHKDNVHSTAVEEELKQKTSPTF